MSDIGNVESSYFQLGEPLEQKIERKEAKGRIKDGVKLLEDIIARLEVRIKFYDTLDSIPAEVRAIPEDFMTAVNANDLTKRNLMNELEYLITLQDWGWLPWGRQNSGLKGANLIAHEPAALHAVKQ